MNNENKNAKEIEYYSDEDIKLAAQHERSRDAAERAKIADALYKRRVKLDKEKDRVFHSSGKGRYLAALNAEVKIAGPARTAKMSRMITIPLYLVPVLHFIMRNGSDRARSIKELANELGCSYKCAEKAYERQRDKLLEIFCA